jgi:hypothetical protein
MLGVRRWKELATAKKKRQEIFDRPKPTTGCSANGRRRRRLNTIRIKPSFLARSVSGLR